MSYYLIYKSLHIISFVAWFAGLFYLPRLYVYHVSAKEGSELDKTLQIMEQKLLRYIMNPAMILTLIFGILLIFTVGIENLGGWFHTKLLLIFLLFGFHGFLAVCRKKFAYNTNNKSEKFYRLINEIPTIILILIVFLSVLKPF